MLTLLPSFLKRMHISWRERGSKSLYRSSHSQTLWRKVSPQWMTWMGGGSSHWKSESSHYSSSCTSWNRATNEVTNIWRALKRCRRVFSMSVTLRSWGFETICPLNITLNKPAVRRCFDPFYCLGPNSKQINFRKFTASLQAQMKCNPLPFSESLGVILFCGLLGSAFERLKFRSFPPQWQLPTPSKTGRGEGALTPLRPLILNVAGSTLIVEHCGKPHVVNFNILASL